MNLGTRAARAGDPHFPKVFFFTEPQHLIPTYVGTFQPECFRFIILSEHSSPQFLFRHLPDVCQQLPRPVDSVPFIVITKRPVSQHLKQGLVIGILAYIFQVVVFAAGADYRLDVGSPFVRTRTGSQKHIFKLVHTSIGEQ